MLLHLNEKNIDNSSIRKITECLADGGVIIYPTDTLYGMGCDIHKMKAVEQICKLKNISSATVNFSFICYDLSHISDYTKSLETQVYKLMKKTLLGPFTFILELNNKVPIFLKSKQKTVGIRIPNNTICRQILKELGNPIMSTSIHDEDEIIEYTTDPQLIYEKYKDKVDILVAGGYGHNAASTVVDCTEREYTILRQGMGILEEYL